MNELASKLKSFEKKVASEKGNFTIFGLLLRDDAPNTWDVVAAAPWIDLNEPDALRYLSEGIQRSLALDELVTISRVVLVPTDGPFAEAMVRAVQVEHGLTRFERCSLGGVEFQDGYVITSKRRRRAKAQRSTQRARRPKEAKTG